jgi:NADPH:quinone reductase-like Zn-dependent oxidoreductase
MKAVVLSEPGPVENLNIVDLPIPEPPTGWVRIAVKVFGLNRSELHTRLGYAQGVTFPRLLGIEATGVIDAAPDSDLQVGQKVATMMGGMGRTLDGGYAEYAIVPRSQVIPFRSDLSWETLGAIPETLQTAYGSLTTGLDLQMGQSLLIRGGTSALGLVTTTLAKEIGATVIATTRKPTGSRRSQHRGWIIQLWIQAKSHPKCARLSPMAWMRRWNWSARRPCLIRWPRRAFTARCASLECYRISGSSRTSTR